MSYPLYPVNTGGNTSDVSKVTLSVPKSVMGAVSRVWMTFLGVVFIIVACLLCLTIIGILVALPLVMVGLGMVRAAKGYVKATCPTCGYAKTYVRGGSLNYTCRKCRRMHIIDWK